MNACSPCYSYSKVLLYLLLYSHHFLDQIHIRCASSTREKKEEKEKKRNEDGEVE